MWQLVINALGWEILATINKDRSITEKHKHGRRLLPMSSIRLGDLFSTPASCTLSVASEPVKSYLTVVLSKFDCNKITFWPCCNHIKPCPKLNFMMAKQYFHLRNHTRLWGNPIFNCDVCVIFGGQKMEPEVIFD